MSIKRVGISLTEKVLRRLDERAEELGVSRSEYLRHLVLNDQEVKNEKQS